MDSSLKPALSAFDLQRLHSESHADVRCCSRPWRGCILVGPWDVLRVLFVGPPRGHFRGYPLAGYLAAFSPVQGMGYFERVPNGRIEGVRGGAVSVRLWVR